jgi:hypothetical protein
VRLELAPAAGSIAEKMPMCLVLLTGVAGMGRKLGGDREATGHERGKTWQR